MEKIKTDLKKKKTNCECCQYYAYDDDNGSFICMRELDEDEMESFVNERNRECPYFNFFDEYKLVQKQN